MALPDFTAHFTPTSTVWRIVANTKTAKLFAREHFPVESWQGTSEDFYSDHRPARQLCEQLMAEGFTVANTAFGRGLAD